MEYRPRTNSTRENVGLRQHSQNLSQSLSQISLEERSTLTTPSALFQRSNSTASINTENSRSDTPHFQEENGNQKIIFQTGARRSSVSKFEEACDAKLIYQTSYGGNVQLKKDETTLGRKDDNDIVLSDVKISKRHAVILRNGSRYAVFDVDMASRIHILLMESD
jgi:hypothetical protein